jgi:UDP-N-acetylmuramate: L-alanyl-gamma-D-glutamyl-meso-diaminopimelate ligase
LSLADGVYFGSVNRAQLLGDEERFSPETVAEAVRARGPLARACASSDDVADALTGQAKAGDVILVMSNGSFDGLTQKLIGRLQPVGSAR